MYVPPDEPIQELGEVNMNFEVDGDDPSPQPNDRTCVNPIYQRYNYEAWSISLHDRPIIKHAVILTLSHSSLRN